MKPGSGDVYAIRLDGMWTLQDLSILPHEYLQVYAVSAHIQGLLIVLNTEVDLPPPSFGKERPVPQLKNPFMTTEPDSLVSG